MSNQTLPEGEAFRSKRGRSVAIRAVRPEDLPAIAALLSGLSQRTVERRYLAPRVFGAEAAVHEAARLIQTDAGRLVLVAHAAGDDELILAVGELVRDQVEPHAAEGAMLVADAYQGEGIGRAVMERMGTAAKGAAISRVRATVNAFNRPMRRLIASFGSSYTASPTGAEVQYEWGV